VYLYCNYNSVSGALVSVGEKQQQSKQPPVPRRTWTKHLQVKMHRENKIQKRSSDLPPLSRFVLSRLVSCTCMRRKQAVSMGVFSVLASASKRQRCGMHAKGVLTISQWTVTGTQARPPRRHGDAPCDNLQQKSAILVPRNHAAAGTFLLCRQPFYVTRWDTHAAADTSRQIRIMDSKCLDRF
jgi:hypothetical protein